MSPDRPADLITFGRGTYGEPDVRWYWGDIHRCRVGNYSSINSAAIIVVGGEHRTDWVTTYPFREALGLRGRYESGLPHSKGDVVIGSDVYIGANAMILSGVTVGDGAVVGAGAVVASDVAPYAVVVGNPAQVSRYRFCPVEREALLRVRWWDWPQDRIEASLDTLQSTDVRRLLEEHDEVYRKLPDSAKAGSARGMSQLE
jgi:acetyltransferase-like isoleucine patch superfamily enzyme